MLEEEVTSGILTVHERFDLDLTTRLLTNDSIQLLAIFEETAVGHELLQLKQGRWLN